MQTATQPDALLTIERSSKGTPWVIAATIATTTAGLMVGSACGAWSGTLPPLHQQTQRPMFQNAISSAGVGAPVGFGASTVALGSKTGAANTIAQLRKDSGLTATQIGRLFGVSRRSVQNWIAEAPMAPQHQERLSVVLSQILPLGTTPEDRRKRLLSSSNGTSLFHRLVNEIPKDVVMQTHALSVGDRLGA